MRLAVIERRSRRTPESSATDERLGTEGHFSGPSRSRRHVADPSLNTRNTPPRRIAELARGRRGEPDALLSALGEKLTTDENLPRLGTVARPICHRFSNQAKHSET